MASFVNLLIAKGVVTRADITGSLHRLLEEHSKAGAGDGSAAPARHLLDIISASAR
jgi:hypothetical protein